MDVTPSNGEQPPLRTGPLRWLLFVTGLLCAALGVLGAFLPVLPTTPFLLLAAACFVRSSPTFHRRLLASRLVGPYIAQWQRDRTVPRAAKRKAYVVTVVTFGLSIWLIERTGMRLALLCIGVVLLAFLAWLPTTVEDARVTPPDA